jgi:BMFP domain-containing protein YqiC
MNPGGNPLFDNLSRLMTDAAGMATGMKREAEGVMKAQLERLIRDMDVVSRDEFDAVRAMAILAREENDRLSARIAALEARLSGEDASSAD